MKQELFFNYEQCRKVLEEAVAHYELTAPTVSRYLDDLYVRLGDGLPVQLQELLQVQALFSEGDWEHPNYAAN